MKKSVSTVSLIIAVLLCGCAPELPVTSSIRIDMEAAMLTLNGELYGLCMTAGDEEGISSELIPNSSFEHEGHSGWNTLAANTYMRISDSRPVSPDNPYSLLVSVYAEAGSRGGVSTGGYDGLPLKKGEKYVLSFMTRTTSTAPQTTLYAALEDSVANRKLSLSFKTDVYYYWEKHTHTFVATEDADHALLTFYIEQSSVFCIDNVSLKPANSWKNHGFRSDVMEKIDSLSAAFILFRGDDADGRQDAYRRLGDDMKKTEIGFLSNDSRLHEKALYADFNYLVSKRALVPLKNEDEVSNLWINGLASTAEGPTLRSAVAEACFLINAENSPRLFRRLSFSPVALRNEAKESEHSLIYFGHKKSFASPSYYMFKMFSNSKGDALLRSSVDTYYRPQTYDEDALFENSDNSFELESWNVNEAERYNYRITANLRRAKAEAKAVLRINGSTFVTVDSLSVLYRQAGNLRDTMSVTEVDIPDEASFSIKAICNFDSLEIFLDGKLIHKTAYLPLPAIVASAVLDRSDRSILLKVVNTTMHDETTEINIRGADTERSVALLQMKGEPELYNSSDSPYNVVPVEGTFQFGTGRVPVYTFPPNSITVMRIGLR